MGEEAGKINFLQLGMIIMLANGLLTHVILNPMLLDASGRDAWIAVIAAGVLLFPWCGLLLYLMRKSGQQNLRAWLAEKTHPAVAWLLMVPTLANLYMMGGLTVIHTTSWTMANYLPYAPKSVLGLVLIVICYYGAKSGLQAIAVSAGILLPIVIILGYFVAISNSPEKDYQLLRPFLEHGWQPVIPGMMYTWSGFVELTLIPVVQHRLNTRPRMWHLALLAFVLIYITLGPIVGAITEFGPREAAKQMESPYEQWRLVQIGLHIEHVDFFSVFQWLAGACIRIGFALFLLGELLPFKSPKTRHRFLLLVALSYAASFLAPINQNLLYQWLYRAYHPLVLAVMLSVSAIWVAIALFSKKEGLT